MNLPVIKDREMYLLGEGFDRMKTNGSIVIICRSLHDVFIFFAILLFSSLLFFLII